MGMYEYLLNKKNELLEEKIDFIIRNQYKSEEKIRIDSEIDLINDMLSEVK